VYIGLLCLHFQCHRSGPLKSAFGTPCVYAGHLKTDKTWYGYIANITIIGNGRVTFEFLYAVDRCCQNILFYTDDQISIISSRLSCWQKEYLLRPEEDQVLRLTPSFSWSGCHDMQLDGVKTYVCKGGRSFQVGESMSERPVTWYVAVSNCAALHGLDLRYQIEIHGQVGECHPKTMTACLTRPAGFALAATTAVSLHTSPNAQLVNKNLPVIPYENTPVQVSQTLPVDSDRTPSDNAAAPVQGADDVDPVCIIEGDVTTLHNWYGFIRNISLLAGGGFRFYFTYPYRMQIQNVIMYREEDIMYLHWEQTCWQKEMIINSMLVAEQVIDLSFR